MTDVRPRRNLDPAAEPWGRRVDNDLDALLRQNERQAQDTGNAFKALNGSLTLISGQIKTLNDLTASLSAQQAELAAAQGTLAAQQASLTSAFNQIAAVSANQVTGASASNSNSSPIGVASGGNYVPASVTVPAGFTRAIVTAFTSIRIAGSSTMALYLSANIQGSVGGTFPIFPEASASVTTAGAAGHAATLTGLTGGQVLNVWGRTTSVSGVSGAYFSNTASFIFLK